MARVTRKGKSDHICWRGNGGNYDIMAVWNADSFCFGLRRNETYDL